MFELTIPRVLMCVGYIVIGVSTLFDTQNRILGVLVTLGGLALVGIGVLLK